MNLIGYAGSVVLYGRWIVGVTQLRDLTPGPATRDAYPEGVGVEVTRPARNSGGRLDL